MQVTIKHIYVSNGHNYFGRYGKGSLDHTIEEQSKIDLVAGKGVIGDRFFDYEPDYKGQITFFNWKVYQDVKTDIVGGDFEPWRFRRNVMIEGVDLNDLIGKKFTLNGIEFTGSCECKPCFWMDEAVTDGTFEFLKGQGGLRARILDDGSLTTGEFELEIIGEVETSEDSEA